MMISYNTFKKPVRQKNLLMMEDKVLTDANIMGGVKYQQNCNADTDIMLGSCTSAVIDFQLENMNKTMSDITGKEIMWKYGTLTDSKDYAEFAKAVDRGLVCLNGNIAYVANETAPYLSVWKLDTMKKLHDVVEANILPVKALLLTSSTLYCGLEAEPFLQVFSVSGDSLTPVAKPVLSEYELSQVNYCVKYRKSVNWQGDVMREYKISYYNLKPCNLTENIFEFIKMGVFIADKPVKVNDTRIRVQAFDRMMLFERNIDEWYSSVVFPISLKNLLKSLCNYVGATLATESFPNEGFQVQRNFEGTEINGRQFLQWIVEIAARFAVFNENGDLMLGWYRDVDYSIDTSNYFQLNYNDYYTTNVDKLQIRVEDSDIGVIVGDGDNAYIIQDNPLLYADSDAELRPTAETIFNCIKDLSYMPYSIKVMPNPLLKAGDIINVTNGSGVKFKALIMDRTLTRGGDEYEATGNMRRTVYRSKNGSFNKLRGRINSLSITLEGTINRVSSVETTAKEHTERIGELQLTDEQLSGMIGTNTESINGNIEKIAALLLTDEKFSASIKESRELIDGNIEKIAELALASDRFKVTLSEQGAAISVLDVNTKNILLSIRNTNVNLTPEGIEVNAGKFNINNNFIVDSLGNLTTAGNVKLGGNITMGGNITWENPLIQYQYSTNNSSWHNTRQSNDIYRRDSTDFGRTWGAGYQFVGTNGRDGVNGKDGKDGKDGSDAAVPGYIKETYIDFSTVASPYIKTNLLKIQTPDEANSNSGLLLTGYFDGTSKNMLKISYKDMGSNPSVNFSSPVSAPAYFLFNSTDFMKRVNFQDVVDFSQATVTGLKVQAVFA